MLVNQELIKLAKWSLDYNGTEQTKEAFTPPDQSAMPPIDPSALAGGGGAVDPTMMAGGAPAMSAAPMIPPAAPAMPAAPMATLTGAGGSKQNKDQLMQSMAMDMWQMKKYMFMLGEALGIKPPMSLMDGPDRDPNSGLPLPPGTPGSTSDPAVMQQEAQQAAAKGPSSAIPPVEPIAPAFPTPTEPGKQAEDNCSFGRPIDKTKPLSACSSAAQALSMLLQRIHN